MKTPSYRWICLVITLSTFISYRLAAQDSVKTFHVGFIYPISSHGADAKLYSNSFSLHALAGVSREERAFAVSGVALIVKENAYGFKVAGLTQTIGGDARDFTASGLANVIGGNTTGFTTAGLFNRYHSGSGFQAAGLMNLAKNSVEGFQAAGLVNTAKEVKGVQLAGLLNKADVVHGAQIGFINIANSNKYPIGIINLIKDGEKSMGITVDDNLSTLLTFRSGSKTMYGIIGVGNNFNKQR